MQRKAPIDLYVRDRVREQMKTRGLTKKSILSRCDLTAEELDNIFKGNVIPVAHLMELCDALAVKSDQLLPPTLGNRAEMAEIVDAYIKRNLGSKMQQLRLSQRKLAELTGVADTTLSHFNTGKNTLRLDSLEQISRGLGVDPEELIRSDDEEAQDGPKTKLFDD